MKKVGLSKDSLYARFRSKREILLKISERFRVRYLNGIAQFVNESEGNVLYKPSRCISFSAKFASEHENLCIFLTFLTTELNTDVDFEPVLIAVYRDSQRFISGITRQGISQGKIDKTTDPDLAALTFMALHDEVLHQWVLNRNFIDPKEYVKTFRKSSCSAWQATKRGQYFKNRGTSAELKIYVADCHDSTRCMLFPLGQKTHLEKASIFS